MNSPETLSSENQSPRIFSFTEKILLFLIILAGVVFRFIFLEHRPVHHDESLHMMYGRYFYDFPDIQYYKYDPMLHGPFLYNALRAVYSTLGSTTEAARAFPALLGSLFLFLPLLFRRWLSPMATVFLTAAIALSPTLTYWSRFIREDVPVMTALMILLYGCTLAPSAWRWSLVFISFSLQVTMKENVFVSAAILAGYLAFEQAFLFLQPKSESSLLQKAFSNLKMHWKESLLGLCVAIFIYIWFLSAGLRYPEGITDFFVKSFSYWFKQHSVERIKGPFAFHIYVLSWYEIPFIIAALVAFIKTLRATKNWIRYISLASIILATALTMSWSGKSVEGYMVWDFFKLKNEYDIFLLITLIPNAVLLSLHHLIRGERNLALWGYLFTASLFTYSYLGEKVPWLTIYAFVPGLIYLALFFDAESKYARQKISWSQIISSTGLILTILGIWFYSESEGTNTNIASSFFPFNYGYLIFILLMTAIAVLSTPFAKLQVQKFNKLTHSQTTLAYSFLLIGILILTIIANQPLQNRDGDQRHDLFICGVGTLLLGLGLLKIVRSGFGEVTAKWFFLSLFATYCIRALILTNFVYAGHAREYLSQVHTTPQFQQIMFNIREEMESGVRGLKPKVYGNGDMTWPLTWYMVGLPEYRFNTKAEERKDYTYQFVDYPIKSDEVTEGFRSLMIPLRGWWVPDFKKVTLKKFLNYTLNHSNWSDTGFSNVAILVKQPAISNIVSSQQ